jgi:hypothetical protein
MRAKGEAKPPNEASVLPRSIKHLSLSSIPTELDRLYKEVGGPAPIVEGVGPKILQRVCRDFPFSCIEPICRPYAKDNIEVRRHWPWIAFAASKYRFERGEKRTYTDEPKPSEILSLLDDVETAARRLVDLLCRMQQLAYRLEDAGNPHRRAHLSWIHEFLLQNLESARPEIGRDPEAFVRSLTSNEIFLKQLVQLRVAAAGARNRVDPKMLQRPRPQRDPAIYNLVWRAATIWQSMTGRHASVNKVHRRDGDTRSDFILFVTSIAKLAADYEPAATEIATAFNTWNRARKKAQ